MRWLLAIAPCIRAVWSLAGTTEMFSIGPDCFVPAGNNINHPQSEEDELDLIRVSLSRISVIHITP